MCCTTNINESVNKVLKYILLSKRECCNWTTIVKKIICYTDEKAKDINTFGFEKLKKTDKNKINS